MVKPNNNASKPRRWFRRLGKWLLLIGIIILVLAPALLGLVLRSLHPSTLTQLDAQLAYQLLEATTKAGWFRSTSQSRWQAQDGSTVVYQSQLRHGPILWQNQRPQLGWWQEQGQVSATESAAAKPLLQLAYSVNLAGMARGDWDVDWHRDWAQLGNLGNLPNGLTGAGSVEFDLLDQRGQMSMQASRALLATAAGQVEGRLALELASRVDGLDLELDAEQLRLAGRPLGDQLTLTAATDAADTLTTIRLGAHGQGLHYLDQVFELTAFQASLARLDQTTLQQLQLRYGELQTRGLEPAMLMGQFQADILLALPTLLQHQAELRIDQLNIDSADGPSRLSLRIEVPEGVPPEVLIDPARLLGALVVQFDGAAPQVLVMRLLRAQQRSQQPWLDAAALESTARASLQQWLTAGWLIESGDQLTMNWRWNRGQLVVNGSPTELPF